MRLNLLIPIGIFIGGVVLVATAVATGEADVSLVLIFPVFSGSSGLFLLGVLLIVVSFLAGFAMIAVRGVGPEPPDVPPTTMTDEPRAARKPGYGGVVLIGPVPIAFGSNRSIALVMLVVGVAMAVLLLGLVLAL